MKGRSGFKQSDFGRMTSEQVLALPWDAPVFAWIPGRYFSGMFYFELPPAQPGPPVGNITAMLWRYEDDPATWIYQWRLRMYRQPGKPNDVRDATTWYATKYKGTEAGASASAEAHLRAFPSPEGSTVRPGASVLRLAVGGDYLRFWEVVARERPPWLSVSGLAFPADAKNKQN